MKHIVTTTLISLISITAAYAGPKEDVKAAAAKLAAAPCYTWTATSEIPGGQFTPAPITGKCEKDGFAIVSQTREGNTSMAVLKGEKGVVKTDDGWKTAEELRAAASGGGGGGGAFMRGALLRNRPPAEEAGKIADKAKELAVVDGAICGDLTEEGAKEQLAFGRGRPGGQAPEVKNAKGAVKYWVKDGVLTKMELKVSGTFSRNGEDRDMTRVTVYEIKDVGATKVEVPAEAKAKLGS
jgi:hypothetical protein